MEHCPAIKKEWDSAICNNMDRPGGHYSPWSKSDRERHILCDITYPWNLKHNRPVNITPTKRNRLADAENHLVLPVGRGRREGRDTPYNTEHSQDVTLTVTRMEHNLQKLWIQKRKKQRRKALPRSTTTSPETWNFLFHAGHLCAPYRKRPDLTVPMEFIFRLIHALS